MTQRPTGPASGNNPNHPLGPYLHERAEHRAAVLREVADEMQPAEEAQR
ncbi:hypothetical protein [Streptomyces sp. NPDC003710]